MKTVRAKVVVCLLAFVFLADAINSDILIALGANTLFHTAWDSIAREQLLGGGAPKAEQSAHSIAALSNPAQDEDSPTTLDTHFPVARSIQSAPDLAAPSLSRGIVRHTYLSLCTLLI